MASPDAMRKNQTSASGAKRCRRSRRKKRQFVLIGSCGLVVLLVTATVAGSWTSFRSQPQRTWFFSPPSPSPLPSPTSPSKEYIYSGGKVIATEEPYPLAAPANLVASTVSNVQINISWSASPNAHHYQIERGSNSGGTFTVLNPNVTTTSFTDNSVSAVNAYLYRVKASDAVGNLSGSSNVDLATAIMFDDEPFPQPPVQTLVKAVHLLQLRQAVNAVRATANLSPAVWSQNPVQQNVTPVITIDIQELRSALDQALGVFGLPTGGYTDPSLSGQVIKKIHFEELRSRVK